MSTLLPSIDLTGAVVGTQKTIDFTTFVKFDPANIPRGGLGAIGSYPNSSQSPNAHLDIYNESGCGLTATMKNSGTTFYIPAGKWGVANIEPNDSTCVLTVTYTLPNPPVSLLTVVYYAPGEEVPPTSTLGNSPIGIGGAVNVSTVQTLSNEGNAANTLVIDIGDTAFAQLFTIFTDGHGIWSVDASGTKHQVLKMNTTSNFLQLGQAGDTVEQLGSELIDQNLTVTSTITSNGTLKVNTIADNVTGATQITLATAGISIPNPIQSTVTIAGGATGLTVNNNALISGTEIVTGQATFNAALPSIQALHGISCNSPGDSYFIGSNGAVVLAIDVNNRNLIMNSPNIGGGGSLALQVGGTSGMTMDASQQCTFAHSVFLPVGSLGQLSTFAGTGNGTVATGVTNPTAIAFDPCTPSGSSQTIGGTVASSSVVTTGAGLAWRGTAWHA